MVDKHVISECTQIIKKNGIQQSFTVFDLQVVRDQLARWRRELPRVDPWMAVKCCPDGGVMRELALGGCGFDVASEAEIIAALEQPNASAERIIFANPCKAVPHVKSAASRGIELTTLDNVDELYKVHKNWPNARVVVRILGDDSASVCKFNCKFGIAVDDLPPLLAEAKRIGANVAGISFHVGSGCKSAESFANAIRSARRAFDMFADLGLAEPKFLDLGGGWPGSLVGFPEPGEVTFEEIAAKIRPVLDELFPSDVQIIAEPGRYFVHAAATLVTQLHSRRAVSAQCLPSTVPPALIRSGSSDDNSSVSDEDEYMSPAKRARMDTSAASNDEVVPGYRYYVNDGCYGAFNCIMYDHRVVNGPDVLLSEEGAVLNPPGPLVECSIWGNTCDGIDCITKSVPLPVCELQTWFVFANMGAYTIAASSQFNGFPVSKVFYMNASAVAF